MDLLQPEVVNEALNVLAQGLGTGGGQRQIVQRKHRNDDPHSACKVIEEVLEVAQCTKQPVEQYQGRAFRGALHVAVTSVSYEILLHRMACA